MAGKKDSMTGKQLGRTDLWTIHQERNKDKQFDVLDIKMPEIGFGWWRLVAITSHSQALLQSTETSSLTKCLSQRLGKGCAPAGRPSAPRKLQLGLLIFVLRICSVFTHIYLCILGQTSPPTSLSSPHTVTQAFCREDCALFPLPAVTLRGSGHCGHQSYASAYPHKHAEAFAGVLVPSCQLIQIRRLFMEIKSGIYDFLMSTL